MTTPNAGPTDNAWALIEKEKQRERFIRKVCKAAWAATFVLVLLITIGVAVPIVQMAKGAMLGALPWMTVVGSAMPLFGALWTLSLLIASLSTIAVFLQARTASLTEIQLRLAALEEMLTSKPETPR